MKSLFYDIHRAVTNAVNKAGFTTTKVLSFLAIPGSWYYAQLSIKPLLDTRFNPHSIAGSDEQAVAMYKRSHPEMSFREIAYTLIDDGIAYLSPSTVYNILKRNGLIIPWKHKKWASTRPEHAECPDERWQTDIMYLKITGRFFYLIIFIDEYSRYIVHHALLTTMSADPVSLEAQTAIEILRKDSKAEPVMQSDNGSSCIAKEFKMVLGENSIKQKFIKPHTPEQNGIVERANKTMRESLVPVILTGMNLE